MKFEQETPGFLTQGCHASDGPNAKRTCHCAVFGFDWEDLFADPVVLEQSVEEKGAKISKD